MLFGFNEFLLCLVEQVRIRPSLSDSFQTTGRALPVDLLPFYLNLIVVNARCFPIAGRGGTVTLSGATVAGRSGTVASGRAAISSRPLDLVSDQGQQRLRVYEVDPGLDPFFLSLRAKPDQRCGAKVAMHDRIEWFGLQPANSRG